MRMRMVAFGALALMLGSVTALADGKFAIQLKSFNEFVHLSRKNRVEVYQAFRDFLVANEKSMRKMSEKYAEADFERKQLWTFGFELFDEAWAADCSPITFTDDEKKEGWDKKLGWANSQLDCMFAGNMSCMVWDGKGSLGGKKLHCGINDAVQGGCKSQGAAFVQCQPDLFPPAGAGPLCVDSAKVHPTEACADPKNSKPASEVKTLSGDALAKLQKIADYCKPGNKKFWETVNKGDCEKLKDRLQKAGATTDAPAPPPPSTTETSAGDCGNKDKIEACSINISPRTGGTIKASINLVKTTKLSDKKEKVDEWKVVACSPQGEVLKAETYAEALKDLKIDPTSVKSAADLANKSFDLSWDIKGGSKTSPLPQASVNLSLGVFAGQDNVCTPSYKKPIGGVKKDKACKWEPKDYQDVFNNLIKKELANRTPKGGTGDQCTEMPASIQQVCRAGWGGTLWYYQSDTSAPKGLAPCHHPWTSGNNGGGDANSSWTGFNLYAGTNVSLAAEPGCGADEGTADGKVQTADAGSHKQEVACQLWYKESPPNDDVKKNENDKKALVEGIGKTGGVFNTGEEAN